MRTRDDWLASNPADDRRGEGAEPEIEYPMPGRKLTPDEESLVRYGKAWEKCLDTLFGGRK